MMKKIKHEGDVTWANGNRVSDDEFEVREIWKVTKPEKWTAEVFKNIYAKTAEQDPELIQWGDQTQSLRFSSGNR